ncbi:MAG: hypothetical protein HGA35_00570 [Erysipelotrichaceae bacterium]|nr:hypothetical protein [Erysipelotrichaceae bacterium]
MANSDKNILIVPNRGQTADPKIVFSGADASTAAQNITMQVYPTSNGTLSFEGSSGQLFSITNNLVGSIFSVNDISGIPSIEVLDTGTIKLGQYSGNVLIGTSSDNGYKLNVLGSIYASTQITSNVLRADDIQVISSTGVRSLTIDSTNDRTSILLKKSGVTVWDIGQTNGGDLEFKTAGTTTSAKVNSSGDIICARYIYPSGAAGGYLWGNASGIWSSGNLLSNSDIYWGSKGVWLSAWLDQAVLTTSTPSFSRVTSTIATGTSPLVVTSTTVVTNLNADTVDGYHATAYNVFTGNAIVTRGPTGYIHSLYINTSADVQTVAPSHFAIQVNTDIYIRWQTLANVKTNLGINNVTNISLSNIFNNSANTHGTLTNFNSVPDFGFYHILGTTNGPSVSGATQYFTWSCGLGSEYGISQYACQFAIPRVPTGGDNTLSVRFRDGGTWMSWNPVIANARKKPITYLSKSGHNSLATLIDGRLFTACGTSAANGNATTGRHASGAAYAYGIDSMKEVMFPETTAKITSTGGYASTVGYALFDNGNLYTWGANTGGQCGVGNTTAQPYPVLASSSVSAVYTHPSNGEYSLLNRLVIKKTDGYLYGAGNANNYQFGLGNTTQQTSFIQMSGATINTQKVFNLGSEAGCVIVLTSDGRILVAGYNNYGQLGNSSTASATTFTDVTTAWSGVASGLLDLKVCFYGGYHNGAIATWISTIVMLITLPNSTKIVKASGYGVNGQLGDGTLVSKTAPVTVLNSTNVIDISLNGIGTCHMLKSDNTVWGWGYNGSGSVGNGTTTDVSTPVQVLTGVSKILLDGLTSYINGHYTICYFVKTDGTLWACGYNDAYRYIPTGSSVANVTTPSKVIIPNNEAVVELGHSTSSNAGRTFVARTSAENLYAWGYNAQQTINTSTIAAAVPSIVPIPNFN